MFDSVLNKIIVILSVFVLCIGLYIGFLFVPVFADTDFSAQPLPVSDLVTVPDYSNYPVYSYNNSNYKIYPTANAADTYCFAFYNSAANNSLYLCIFNSSSGVKSRDILVRASASWNNLATDLSSYDSTYDVYYNIAVMSYTNLNNIPVFNSLEDGFAGYNESITPNYEPLYDGFNLPRGYLARITFRDNSFSDNNSITLTSIFGNKSNAITGRFNSSQWYRFINTDLASIVLQYESLGTKISWSPFGHHTTLGQYENGSFTLTGSSSTQLWVVNPVYQSYQINSLGVALAGHGLNGVLNNNVVINDPSGIIDQIRIFPLSSGLVAGVDGVVNETNEDAYQDVNGSTSGAFTYTDSNGNITGSVPQNGATLVDDTTATSLDILNTIKNAFNDLINRLESIFHPAQGFFNTILGSFNDFVHWLSQLWSWLPTPIVGLIEAVLYISILVGCIKLIF